jgi:membrane fusion protein
VLLAVTVEYAPVHRVPAYVDAPNGTIRLSAFEDARVATLAVAEGASVERGQVLATLSTDRRLSRDTLLSQRVTNSLADDRRTLKEEEALAREEARVARQALDRRIADLREELASIRREIDVAERLLASARTQSERIAKIGASGHASAMQVEQKRDEVTQQEGRVASLQTSIARVQRDINAATADREAIETRLLTTLANRARSRSEIDRLQAAADASAEEAIVAPEAGVVSATLVTVGQSIQAGQAVVVLSPRDAPPMIRIIVPSRVIAAMVPGKSARVELAAYPVEKFGSLPVVIRKVSDTPLLPAELPDRYHNIAPAYVAIAEPVIEGPSSSPLAAKIRPGMLAEAMVSVERRRIIEWLLEPVLRGLGYDRQA